ncbi:PTS sugar transporter subunit IIB [Thermoanaerobacterium thermosaccharolyticum]|uniref:Phosphotransferase system, galactitol-specific IIB component n=1 Tax=Thermoanaerobacterium thermosaccharolyticum M0795 TaxID=698948 RepID=L0IJ37_THETR|nr:PTS sugar transporter subunit IIB [Thermoanaerobacterium thermosaccharolyticum]AGB19530.1 phosphotransferase system, galactitol-specific IIB component [Thermoanaerobacterium thermosaccharolyticum M0795]
MKKVLVCCGSSMITSSVAINKLKEVFKKENIDVTFGQCKFSEVPSMAKTFKPDVIVPTGPLDEKAAGGVPIVRGTSFITGVGEKETVEQILNILKK